MLMNTNKVISLLEDLLKEVKASGCTAAAPVKKGNRTPPRTDYRGGNPVQDLCDVIRRAVRLARNGKVLSKKERNLARKVLKKAKADRPGGYSVQNTNGVDIWTHNHL
jgi:hypothetical protein